MKTKRLETILIKHNKDIYTPIQNYVRQLKPFKIKNLMETYTKTGLNEEKSPWKTVR